MSRNFSDSDSSSDHSSDNSSDHSSDHSGDNSGNNSSDGTEIESPPKKQKSEPTPFTEKSSSDDICLQFDDGKKLYVHPVFLFLASAVFKAMFDHDCVEKKTNTVTLQKKKSEDFLEFLMCLHPAHQRPVDKTNVLRIVRLANEYQVPGTESRCQAVMESWLSECANRAKKIFNANVAVLKMLKKCLVILNIANKLNYLDVKEEAIDAIARFGIGFYTDHDITGPANDKEMWDEMRKECTEMFAKMPVECKSMVFLQRLKNVDKANKII